MKNFFCIIFALFTFFSCQSKKAVSNVERETLFKINYGAFENEINLFDLLMPKKINTYLTVRDGFFYIANGEGKKILAFNSYGDLLTLYYNEDFNQKSDFASNIFSTPAVFKAISHPFNTLGPLALDSQKNLYAVDILPNERCDFDAEKSLFLSNVVLIFSPNGIFTDFLGQEGLGGSPFPLIKNIFTTKKDELVVVCKTNNGFDIFWFDQSFNPLYKIEIDEKSIPNPLKKNESDEFYISLDNVAPDMHEHTIFVCANFFKSVYDPTLKVKSSIDFSKTLLFPLDVKNQEYGKPLEIGEKTDLVSSGLGKTIFLSPYEFLGISDDGMFFFTAPFENGIEVQIIKQNGRGVVKRRLSTDKNRNLFYSVCLSREGIICGMFAGQNDLEVAWWRTDIFSK